MGKIVFLLITGVIIWLLFKKSSKPRARADGPSAPSGNSSTTERMVACARCGVFMPESESEEIAGKVYCRDPATCRHGRG